MFKQGYIFSVCALLIGINGAAAQTETEPNPREQLEAIAVIDQKVMVPMRDGIRLCTDIYRPKTDQKVPVIFSRTPYNFNGWRDGEESTRTYQRAMEAVKRGYAYVVQNERGRYFSEGQWDILGTPLTDAADAFTWMAKQDWCNGRVGTLGCSSTAEWQMAAASLDHPALAAMVPQGFGAGVGRVGPFFEQGNWYRGGAVQMLFIAWLYGVQNDRVRPMFPPDATQEELIRNSRYFDLAPERPPVDWSEALKHLPVQDIIKNVNGPIGIYEKMIRRKPNDPDWYKGGLYHDDMPFHVPSFWFVSWFDVASSPNLALFNHVRENAADQNVRDNQYLVIAPTLHCGFTRATEQTMVGELNVGDARFNHDELVYGWFDAKLKQDNAPVDMPRVKYYTMGSNRWQTSDTWPPAGVEMTPFYLNSDGSANTLNGDGRLSRQLPGKEDQADTFEYDPQNPVTSYGGNVCCTGNAIKAGSFDQRTLELRDDILVYTTEPLREGVEVSGFIEATLYVSSDAKDTDFTIKLIDVYPDGRAFNLDETIQRVRYREGYDQEVFMEPGQVYKLEVSPMSTSNYFAKGHSIRIEVSSSNFPRFARNLNTGGNNFDEAKGVVARNQVHHSDKYPSQIRLPIAPGNQ
ncbi:MAG: CocE/NonD family hydrolase [Mariniblastus sp.]|nr:CocE/NonD family hydrolase [Mariniblastus sp.]